MNRLHSVLYELASRGNAVFLGRGGHILLRSFQCTLHIRVSGSLENRIENLVGRGWHREVAIKAIHKSEQGRGAFIKFSFKVEAEEILRRVEGVEWIDNQIQVYYRNGET